MIKNNPLMAMRRTLETIKVGVAAFGWDDAGF